MKCMDNPDEPAEIKTESQRKLPCLIANDGEPINHLWEGIKLSLTETVNKNSPSLGKNADYMKSSKIKNLPPFLVV